MKQSIFTTFRKLENTGEWIFSREDVEDEGMTRDSIVELVEGSDALNVGDDLTGCIPIVPIIGAEFAALQEKLR